MGSGTRGDETLLKQAIAESFNRPERCRRAGLKGPEWSLHSRRGIFRARST